MTSAVLIDRYAQGEQAHLVVILIGPTVGYFLI